VVAYYLPEPSSIRVQQVLQGSSTLVISELVHLEFYAALALRVRTNTLSLTDSQKVTSLFEEHIKAGYYAMTPLTRQHYQQARAFVRQPTLAIKAPDTLHLAVALLGKHDLLTLDAQLIRNALQTSVKVTTV
jgi:predicted nucleic acid-binding protein